MTKINRNALKVGQEVFTINAFNETKRIGVVTSVTLMPADNAHVGAWKKTLIDNNGTISRFRGNNSWIA